MCSVASVVSDSLWPHGLYPALLLCPWNFSGKDTGVGCHALLQGIFPTQGLNLHLQHCRRILYHQATWEALLKWCTSPNQLGYLCKCLFPGCAPRGSDSVALVSVLGICILTNSLTEDHWFSTLCPARWIRTQTNLLIRQQDSPWPLCQAHPSPGCPNCLVLSGN